jgi:hypothetical protein
MPHVMKMFERDYIHAADLDEKERVLVIERVEQGALDTHSKTKKKMPIVYFKGAKKGLGINVTNAKTLIALYGPHTEKWIGKAITIYPTTTDSPEGRVDCIRIRQRAPEPRAVAPRQAAGAKQEPQPAHDPATGEVPPDQEPPMDEQGGGLDGT